MSWRTCSWRDVELYQLCKNAFYSIYIFKIVYVSVKKYTHMIINRNSNSTIFIPVFLSLFSIMAHTKLVTWRFMWRSLCEERISLPGLVFARRSRWRLAWAALQ